MKAARYDGKRFPYSPPITRYRGNLSDHFNSWLLVRVNSEPQPGISEMQYWWMFSVSLLAPLASFWIESAWVFRREIRHYQALIYCLDRPALWIIAVIEVLLTISTMLVLRRLLGKFAIRWGIVLCLYFIWTSIAFWIMPGVSKYL